MAYDTKILKIGGSANLEPLDVAPATAQQTIVPVDPIDGFNQVTVEAVTSAIDTNIQPGNIKKDINILGVTGTLEGGLPITVLTNLTNNDITEIYDDTTIVADRRTICPNCTIVEMPNLTTVINDQFNSYNNLKNIILPSLQNLSVRFNYSNTKLSYCEVGVLTSMQNSVFNTLPNLKMFKVGVDTDINITLGGWNRWTATNVITTEEEQLQLIDNARTGLLERVKDHTGEVGARICYIEWISTLSSSPYQSVQDALLELQFDADDKGWTFA